MAKKTYTNEQLKEIIAEAKTELAEVLKAEVSDVKVPEESSMTTGAVNKEEMSKAPPADMGTDKPEESSSVSMPVPEESSSSSSTKSPSESSSSESSSSGSSSESIPEEGQPDDLVQAYSQLNPEELQNHLKALQQVLSQQQPAPAPASAPEAPASPDLASQNALKAEKELNDKLAKSEAKTLQLENKVETLVKAMELILRKPERKSITGKDLVKTEEPAVDVSKLSKAELTQKLTALARKPELKKSERTLINSFYKGEVKVEDLAVLFEKK